jgi:phosphoribosylaminoimidazole carboxylase (NCAIR synthetase)
MSATALRTACLRGISMLVMAGIATALVSMLVAARVANGIAARVLPLSARAERLVEGDLATASSELAADKGVHLHLYGKGEARPGRKMGHFTKVET